MTSERYDHRFLFNAENPGMRLLWAHLHIANPVPLAPFGHRFYVAQIPAQRRVRSARSLYESSDGVRGRGAAVQNLSHGLPSNDQITIDPHKLGLNNDDDVGVKLMDLPAGTSLFI